jgi:adenine-specific DNA-methyltransferase
VTVQSKTPKQALNKAYLKLKPSRDEIERFRTNLIRLLDKIDEREYEEHSKNLVRDFLLDTYYKGDFEINVKNRNDLVIHSDRTSASPVSVIIEAKRPSERYAFPSVTNLNVKAVRELVLYYLRERIDCKNSDIRHLIATNGFEWFVFDGADFYKYFYCDTSLVKEYEKWNSNQKDSASTEMFYNDIASKYIDKVKFSLPFAYFNIKDYEKFLRNEDKEDDKNLIPLYKLLSPAHLLKQAFSNDSNSLDKNFYFELLHIIGLEEVKDGGKKVIQRKKKPDAGSLLENTINILISEDRLRRVNDPESFGKSSEERHFAVALELCITWINRILFLKLLEAQLLKYHKGDREYKFLTYEGINSFDALNKLFFQVLAVRPEDRREAEKKKFARIPYLNSSLFELSGLEDDLIRISNLEDDPVIPVISKTVLKDNSGKKVEGELNTLQYLFSFLDAYDFSSEGSEDIAEERKTLINASVLGLIFEKINGYKDGSFFTPGFITMYMCRETVRRAVIQKFNDEYRLEVKDFGELKNFVGSPYKREDIAKYNSVINSLKICDPAVGSGHFLVSALNEIIAVKSELNILSDGEGNRITSYSAFVENDELMLADTVTGDLFEYLPENKESRRIQEALFHEKQAIIENCLFGVDINHNSVKICRLRLWIELLKNSYYTKASGYKELETLPNIDINIKCGNSLVSRFSLDADLSSALRKSKWNITGYRLAVQSYQNARTKDEKRSLESLINEIKTNFRTEISTNDPKQKRLESLEKELYEKYTSSKLIDVELSDKEKAREQKEKKKLEDQVNRLSAEIKEIKESAIYRNAFEWRFEFPEVLDEKGSYIGFDVVIGNPPYFSISNDPLLQKVAGKYKTYSTTGDIYGLFIELGINIARKKGMETLIVSNKWLRANYGKNLRNYAVTEANPVMLIDFGQNLIFDSAIVHNAILMLVKDRNENKLDAVRFPDNYSFAERLEFEGYIEKNTLKNLKVTGDIWNVVPESQNKLKEKAEKAGKILKDWNIEFRRGLLTGLNEAFIIDGTAKAKLIRKDPVSEKVIRPILRGRDTRRYFCEFKDWWILNIEKGFTIKTNLGFIDGVREPVPPRYGNMHFDEAWEWFRQKLPAVSDHLEPFKDKAEIRLDKGDFWWELRACAYHNEFERPKIIFSEIVSEPQFYYDESSYYPEATVFFISGQNLKYLTALLNSKAVTYLFKHFYMGGELVGKIRYKKSFLEQVPFPIPDKETENKISALVDKIQSEKRKNTKADTSKLESEIDRMAYQLYGFTDEEIEIVERG